MGRLSWVVFGQKPLHIHQQSYPKKIRLEKLKSFSFSLTKTNTNPTNQRWSSFLGPSKTLPKPTNIRKVNFPPPDHREFATETLHTTMSIVATGTPSVAQNLYQGLMELGNHKTFAPQTFSFVEDGGRCEFWRTDFSLKRWRLMMIFMSAEDSKFFAESIDAACTSQRWTGYQDISSRFHIFIGGGGSATSPIHEILLVGSLSHTGTIVRLIIEGSIIRIGG